MLLGTILDLTFYNKTEKFKEIKEGKTEGARRMRVEEQRGQLEQMLQENEKVRTAEANRRSSTSVRRSFSFM